MSNLKVSDYLIKKIVQKTIEGCIEYMGSNDVKVFDVGLEREVSDPLVSMKKGLPVILTFVLPKLEEIGVSFELEENETTQQAG